MAMRLAYAFETTPEFWLDAQNAVDLWIAYKKKVIRSILKQHLSRIAA
jgi:plasmid maintenance system antidote protein VapI